MKKLCRPLNIWLRQRALCAIESAHAVAGAMKYAKNMGENEIILITLSGRGDKDVAAIARYRGQDLKE